MSLNAVMSMPNRILKAPSERWSMGILWAFAVVLLWGIVFLTLVENRQKSVDNVVYITDPTAQQNLAEILLCSWIR